MYSTRLSGLRIERDLKCKNGCGFYGNAQCDMLCSKCYREKIMKERQTKGMNVNKCFHFDNDHLNGLLLSIVIS